jgi:putative transposase
LAQFQQRIGAVSERALRHDGILLHGIRYCSDTLQSIIGKFGEGVKVRVLFDPEDLGAIQVWGPSDENPVTVLAIDQAYACGLTELQNDMVRKLTRERGAQAENRTALLDAKHQLVVTVQELMASRKQHHRRKSATIRGLSSSNPSAEIQLVTPAPSVTASQKNSPRPDPPGEKPEPAYRSFRLKI